MLNVTHQGAARDAARVHIRPGITRTDYCYIFHVISYYIMLHYIILCYMLHCIIFWCVHVLCYVVLTCYVLRYVTLRYITVYVILPTFPKDKHHSFGVTPKVIFFCCGSDTAATIDNLVLIHALSYEMMAWCDWCHLKNRMFCILYLYKRLITYHGFLTVLHLTKSWATVNVNDELFLANWCQLTPLALLIIGPWI